MGYDDRGYGEALEDLAQLRSDPGAGRDVEGAQGLIQQQKSGVPGHRPGQGDPLLLASREVTGCCFGEVSYPDEVEGVLDPSCSLALVEAADAVGGVVRDREVREQGVALDQVPYVPLLRGHASARFGVEEHATIQLDTSLVRVEQAGQEAEHRALATPGVADQGERLRPNL